MYAHTCCKTKRFLWKNVLGKIYFRSKNLKIMFVQKSTHNVMKRYLRFIRLCCLTLCRKCSSNLFTQIFHKIDVPKISKKNHGKMSVLKSPFNKVKALQIYWKGTSTHAFSCEICEIFKDISFKEDVQRNASLWVYF